MDKKRVLKVCTAAVLAFVTSLSAADAKTLTQLINESRSTQNRISANQAQLQSAQDTKAEAVSDLQQLDNQLQVVRNELVTLNGKLSATIVKLQKSQQDYDDAVIKKNEQHDTLLKRIRVMYENSVWGYMDALFEAKSFTDFFKRLEYAKRIMDYDKKLLMSYQAAEEIIATNLETIKNEKANIESLQQQQLDKQLQLDTAIENKRAFIQKMDSDSEVYRQNILSLQAQDDDIKRLIQQTQAISEAAQRQSESTQGNRGGYVPYSSYSYSSGSSVSSSSGSYQPVYQPVQTRQSTQTVSSQNTDEADELEEVPGTDITYDNEDTSGFGYDDDSRASSSDVVAAAEGTVIYAGNKDGYGKCVIIDHGDGYSTVYANNNYIDVSLGQTVQRGEVIGGAGDSGYSSGTHSDFEAKIGGQHMNVDSYIDE